MQVPKLRHWREARALTQVELARAAGISPRSVAGYEAGSSARGPTVRKLAEALDVEIGDLVDIPNIPKVEGPYTPGRLRAKNGVPPQVILWVGPYEVEIDNRKLSWRDAKGVSDWLAGVRGLVGSGRLSPEDAPEHFYEGMLILDSIVESMPLGHADTAAPARMEVEAVRNAFVASCAALNEIFSTAGAVEDLSPREQQRLLDTIKLTGSITFDLNLRGVGVSREGRKAEERYRNQIARLAGRLSA